MARSWHRGDDEAGFSLVELLVIVVILGILAVISISTYLSQRQTAERASAVSTLRNVRFAAEALRSEESEYPSDPELYASEQPAYRYVPGSEPSGDVDEVSVDGAADGSWVAFAVRSRDRCYYLRVEVGSGDPVRSTSDAGTPSCTAASFPADPTGEWS